MALFFKHAILYLGSFVENNFRDGYCNLRTHQYNFAFQIADIELLQFIFIPFDGENSNPIEIRESIEWQPGSSLDSSCPHSTMTFAQRNVCNLVQPANGINVDDLARTDMGSVGKQASADSVHGSCMCDIPVSPRDGVKLVDPRIICLSSRSSFQDQLSLAVASLAH